MTVSFVKAHSFFGKCFRLSSGVVYVITGIGTWYIVFEHDILKNLLGEELSLDRKNKNTVLELKIDSKYK